MVTDSIRNIKSMWEKGNVFTSPGSGGSTFKVKDEVVEDVRKLVKHGVCLYDCSREREREEKAQFTDTSCSALLPVTTRLS